MTKLSSSKIIYNSGTMCETWIKLLARRKDKSFLISLFLLFLPYSYDIQDVYWGERKSCWSVCHTLCEQQVGRQDYTLICSFEQRSQLVTVVHLLSQVVWFFARKRNIHYVEFHIQLQLYALITFCNTKKMCHYVRIRITHETCIIKSISIGETVWHFIKRR